MTILTILSMNILSSTIIQQNQIWNSFQRTEFSFKNHQLFIIFPFWSFLRNNFKIQWNKNIVNLILTTHQIERKDMKGTEVQVSLVVRLSHDEDYFRNVRLKPMHT